MSARDAMAAMLDELMGPKRNDDKNTSYSFRDGEVCKYYLVGFCPHDMFVNTKSDLGPCPRIHDDKLKDDYKNSSDFEHLGYEKEFLNCLIDLHEAMAKKIRRQKEGLQKRESKDVVDVERKVREEAELKKLDDEIEKAMAQAELAGSEGDVAGCQEFVELSEQLKAKRQTLKEQMDKLPTMDDPTGAREMEVCEVCGSKLIKGDAQVRVEEHLTGKMHVGYSKIAATIEELRKKRVKDVRDSRDSRESTRDSRESREHKDRDRDRRSDRGDHRRSDRRRRSRSRSRDRDRRDRSRDRRRR